MSIGEDPYLGKDPGEIWGSPLSGRVGGLEQLGPDGETCPTNWETVEACFATYNIGAHLRDKVIIELGCGSSVLFRDYCLSRQAKEYIGVDLWCPGPPQPQNDTNTIVRYVQKDMLRFLESQPDNSALIAQFSVLRDEMISREIRGIHGAVDGIVSAICAQIARVVVDGEGVISLSIGDLFKTRLLDMGFIQEHSLFLRKPVRTLNK